MGSMLDFGSDQNHVPIWILQHVSYHTCAGVHGWHQVHVSMICFLVHFELITESVKLRSRNVFCFCCTWSSISKPGTLWCAKLDETKAFKAFSFIKRIYKCIGKAQADLTSFSTNKSYKIFRDQKRSIWLNCYLGNGQSRSHAFVMPCSLSCSLPAFTLQVHKMSLCSCQCWLREITTVLLKSWDTRLSLKIN